MIKLVIIDIDDTLTLTEEACFMIENHIAEKMGLPPMSRGDHKKNWGKPIRETIAERIPEIDTEQFMELHKTLLSGFVKEGKLDNISDKNMETLKTLKDKGKRIAIQTSRTFHEVEHLLDKNHDINKWIDKIYYADNSKCLKPDPRVFKQILDDFNVQPEEAVYVGGSVSDGISAKGARLHFIASLESGLRTKENFKSISVDYFVNSFPEILDYIL